MCFLASNVQFRASKRGSLLERTLHTADISIALYSISKPIAWESR